jgi:hypothetical protein
MKEESNEILLEFEGGGSFPVYYETSYMGNTYIIRYRDGYLTIEQDDNIDIFEQELSSDADGVWTDEEANVYLMLISKAIITNTLNTLKLPTIEEALLHEFYKRGQWPKYSTLSCKQDHKHDSSCPHKIIPAKELDEESYNKLNKFYADYRKKTIKCKMPSSQST